jgi:transposase-like protein
VKTDTSELEIEVPRDRDATFDPKLVRKRQRRLAGFDEKVIALYARGMTTREIQGHLSTAAVSESGAPPTRSSRPSPDDRRCVGALQAARLAAWPHP